MSSRSDKHRTDQTPPRVERSGPRLPGRIRPRRERQRIALAVTVAVVLLAIGSLHRIETEERAYRRASVGGTLTRLQPGWRIALPFLQQVVRMPDGPLRVTGDVSLEASGGESLSVPYEVWARIDDAALESLLGLPDGENGAPETMRRAASDAIQRWGRGRTAETIVLLEGGPEAESAARSRLQGAGFEDVVVALQRVESGSSDLAALTRRALGTGASGGTAPIALIGLDGADWQIVDPLLARGELPTLARLKANGAWGNVKSMSPMLSPLLWTTVATGKGPDKHGIIDFMVRDEKSGQAVPVSSRWRKVKALWNIFTDAGRESAFIAWWATWPAEEVRGHLISDRVAYSLFGYEAGEADLAGATHPPSYLQHIRPSLVDDASITLAGVRQFAPIDAAEFRAQRVKLEADRNLGLREPVNRLTRILSSSKSYQAIALDILSRGQPDLFALYYQGIDEVCHRFAHYMPPRMAMVSDEEYATYRDVVENYYRYQDRQLGEVLGRLSPDTTVIVLSDHGFENGSGRPKDDPPYIEGKPGLWHRRYGMVILSGPAIRPGRLDTTSLLDIAPTILYLSGMPLAGDMEGRIIEEAIDADLLQRRPRRTLASYERVGMPLRHGGVVAANEAIDAEMIEQLRALGYVGGAQPVAGAPSGASPASLPDDDRSGQSLVTGHLNEAGIHLQNKDYRAAEVSVARAIAIAPEFIGAWLLKGQIAAEQKHYGDAIAAAHKVLQIDPQGEPQIYTQLGDIYVDSERLDEGLAYLRGMAGAHPRVAEIRSAIGSLLLAKGEEAAAEKELLASLSIDPALSEPLAELHTLFRGTERILELEEIVRKGLTLDDRSVVHHNWMGLIHEWRNEMGDAEREFQQAIELDPEYTATMANLGALYGRTGRLDQAVAILSRAVDKESDNVEAWVNLGAAQGRLGRAREAIEALETARRLGARTTTLFNALALAYLQARERDKALEYLNESLQIDPDQQDARELLKAVRRPS